MKKRKSNKEDNILEEMLIWVFLMITLILLLVYVGWKIGIPIFIGLLLVNILFSKQKMNKKKQALKEFLAIVLVLSLLVTVGSFGMVGVVTSVGLIWSYLILRLLYKMFIQKKSFLKILIDSSSNNKKRDANSTSSIPPLTGAGEDYNSHSSSSDSGGD